MTKFCTECGTQMKMTQGICSNCGAMEDVHDGQKKVQELSQKGLKIAKQSALKAGKQIAKTAQEVDKEKLEDVVKQMKVNSPKLSKKMVMSIVGIIGGLILVAGGYTAVSKSRTPEKKIEAFEDAIINKDVKQLENILVASDKRLEINEESIKSLLAYFEEAPSSLNEVITELENGIEQGVFNIIEKEGMMPSYGIEVAPVFFTVTSEVDHTIMEFVELGSEVSVEKDEEKEIGPYMPGLYHIEATFNDGNREIKETAQLNLFDMAEGKTGDYITLFNNARSIDLYSDYKDAKVYIDGKDTGKTIEELNEIGPITKETKIYCVLDREGQTFKSEEIVVGDRSSLNIEFPEYEAYLENKAEEASQLTKADVELEVYLVIDQYVSSFADAVNTGDFSYIKDSLYPGSQLYKTQEKNIKDMHDRGIRERFISSSPSAITFNEKTKEGTVTVEEVYEVIKIKENTKKEMTFTNVYGFKYNEALGYPQLTTIEVN